MSIKPVAQAPITLSKISAIEERGRQLARALRAIGITVDEAAEALAVPPDSNAMKGPPPNIADGVVTGAPPTSNDWSTLTPGPPTGTLDGLVKLERAELDARLSLVTTYVRQKLARELEKEPKNPALIDAYTRAYEALNHAAVEFDRIREIESKP